MYVGTQACVYDVVKCMYACNVSVGTKVCSNTQSNHLAQATCGLWAPIFSTIKAMDATPYDERK
jgi:hypothetical protein